MAYKFIDIADVPDWLTEEYDIPTPTRQTVYNWIKNGKQGVKLKATTRIGKLYCYERWLHEFAQALTGETYGQADFQAGEGGHDDTTGPTDSGPDGVDQGDNPS